MMLKIWIASFIPQTIAGYTKPVPGGGGKTMIPGPTPASDCFLTDQRSFSVTPTAASRTRSSVEIDLNTMTLQSQQHHCDNTVEVDCEDGEVECNKTPDNGRLKVEGFDSAGAKCAFSFAGGAGNPCAPAGAPDIDWLVHVAVEKQAGNKVVVSLRPNSVVEPFPAFEMYASLNGMAKEVFRRSPDPGATPWDLYGDPNKLVTGSATLP